MMKTYDLLPASLTRRFMLFMTALSVVGVALLALGSYYEQVIEARNDAKGVAMDRTAIILDAMETSATGESFSRFIASVSTQPSVQSIVLVDDQDRIGFASEQNWQGRELSSLDHVFGEQWLFQPRGKQAQAYWDSESTQVVVVAPIELVNPASAAIQELQAGKLLFVLDARPYLLNARNEAWFDAAWAGGILIIIMLVLSRILHQQVVRPLEFLYRRAHEPANASASRKPGSIGKIRELKVLAEGISELADTRMALAKEKERLSDIADTIPGLIYEYRHYAELEGEFTYLSEGVHEVFGLEKDLQTGTTLTLRPGDDLWSRVVASDLMPLRDSLNASSVPLPSRWEAEFRIQVNGDIRCLWAHSLPVTDNNSGQLFRGVILDVTQRKELENRLKQAATHDALTGALNRAGLEPHLEASLAGAQRHGHPMSVALVDIDYFKQVNDTYGHNLGDSVLVQLVGILQKRLRKADSLARWGGEEFLILLPNTAEAGALQLAEELRQAVEQTVFEHHQPLTISIGVATAQTDDSLKSLVRRADHYLYAAKNSGRNQVGSESTRELEPTGD